MKWKEKDERCKYGSMAPKSQIDLINRYHPNLIGELLEKYQGYLSQDNHELVNTHYYFRFDVEENSSNFTQSLYNILENS